MNDDLAKKKVEDVLAQLQECLGPIDDDDLGHIRQAIEKVRRSKLPAWAVRVSRVKTVRAEKLVLVHIETKVAAEQYLWELLSGAQEYAILPEVEDQEVEDVEVESIEPYDEDKHGSLPDVDVDFDYRFPL